MLGLKKYHMIFDRLNMLAHGTFRLMLASVGMGFSFSPFPIAFWRLIVHGGEWFG